MTRVPNLSAQSPPPTTANGKTSAAVVAIQESNPTSPEELITAINQLVVFQELELAKRYAASLDQIDLQSDNLAALGETIGSLPLLHIIGNKQLDQKGRDNCQKILDALITKRTSPERLARLAREATSDDPRKRQHAITDLRVAGPGAIVPLVAILADPRQAASRDAAIIALYQMGDQTIAPLLAVLEQAGCEVTMGSDWVRVQRDGDIQPVDVTTLPHPGFPTDMQAQVMALMCVAKGKATLTETIFENRFMHVPELTRMGAQIEVSGNRALVTGNDSLRGASVMATDLRASASLVLAGLAAIGETRVLRLYHLDRGYSNLVQKLQAIGAQVQRTPQGRAEFAQVAQVSATG